MAKKNNRKQESATPQGQQPETGANAQRSEQSQAQAATGDSAQQGGGNSQAPEAPSKAEAKVAVVLAKDAPVAALVVAGVRIERNQVGRIPKSEFARLRKQYHLEEAKE